MGEEGGGGRRKIGDKIISVMVECHIHDPHHHYHYYYSLPMTSPSTKEYTIR